MAAAKSLVSICSSAALLLLLIALAAQTQMARSQNCVAELSNLETCAPFVVPGAANVIPSSGCCTALQHVDHDCLCSTLRIVAQMPSACKLPPVTCAA